MPLDGGFIYNLKSELTTQLSHMRVEKIYQPFKDEVIIGFRGRSGSRKLLVSVRPSAVRINLTDSVPENPAQPPMFCMLLRKYLGKAVLTAVNQPDLERMLEFEFSAYNEMGDEISLKLIVELIPSSANIILVNGEGKIIDSLRRSDIETSVRIIQPGASYMPLQSENKLSILKDDVRTAVSAICESESELSKAIVDSLMGFSPLISREITLRVCGEEQIPACRLSSAQRQNLHEAIEFVKDGIISGGVPMMLFAKLGEPMDFSYIKIAQYGEEYRCVLQPSFCELLDKFFRSKDELNRVNALSSDIKRTVGTLLSRSMRKLEARKKDLQRCVGRDRLRICGELLKANLSNINRGASVVRVVDYYDPEQREIEIKLNPTLSPAQNIEKYFKDYKKLCVAAGSLEGLIADNQEEIKYLESVAEELSRAQTAVEISEIKDELASAGYTKGVNPKAKRKTAPLKPRIYTSPDGFEILVGRNNKHNDQLTLSIADKSDLWLHTKEIHGSHVIVRCNKKTPPDSTVLYAAQLAAFHSKARNSSQVPVDYTLIKYVKKPGGAKPGRVIYSNNQTVFVTPRE
ncbi:MAG: NFACT RNA binding domain-containing protein [bacterium]|nr:NFACT RNA binding domain-containing protein [bacterium]